LELKQGLQTKDKQILELKHTCEQQRIEWIQKTEELQRKDDQILELKRTLEAKERQCIGLIEETNNQKLQLQEKEDHIYELKQFQRTEVKEQEHLELTEETAN
jgi:diphthamide synthase subunit DPH2